MSFEEEFPSLKDRDADPFLVEETVLFGVKGEEKLVFWDTTIQDCCLDKARVKAAILHSFDINRTDIYGIDDRRKELLVELGLFE